MTVAKWQIFITEQAEKDLRNIENVLSGATK